jgi:superfamily I DNA/RNA helicase/mRNA-degrading endonuclease RelE of RelBE toxin-antitoxin system
MHFRIADTFTDSLAKLSGDEQKAAKLTVFDLQADPAAPGLKFHKLDKAKDRNFWSVRVNSDLRMIVHRQPSSLLICYVDHHDNAYRWAERRKLETHPQTGAAQFVVIRETVIEIAVRKAVEAVAAAAQKPRLFAASADADLLGFGVPQEWLGAVRDATEDTLLDVVEYLPAEAAEALLQLATGGLVPRPEHVSAETSGPGTRSPRHADVSAKTSRRAETEPALVAREDELTAEAAEASFAHPDAQRRFRLIENRDELAAALEYPWEKWTTFLHPAQRDLVERIFSGAARVSGSAGTGKTVVALHRAAHLARANRNSRVLLATFSDTLAHALRTKLRRLIGAEPLLGERIDVASLDAIGLRLHRALIGPVKLAARDDVSMAIRAASAAVPDHKFNHRFLLAEWEQIVDAWQLGSWDAYRDVARLGRKTRVAETQRRVLWAIFEKVRADLGERALTTPAGMFAAVTAALVRTKHLPFDFAVIDESQDLSIAQLKLLAVLGGGRPNALFFAGDLGQRIFQTPFSWKSLGVDVRGRSSTLRVNYRTSHQIRTHADRLLESEGADVDGNRQTRAGTVSVFNGPAPEIETFVTAADEAAAVGRWLAKRIEEGVLPHEIAFFVRSPAEIDRARAVTDAAKLAGNVLDEQAETVSGRVSLCTMHLAKGLEFRAVAVMACDDEVIPSQQRIEAVGDDADLQEIYDTERQLLYVACTRARDRLLVTSVEPASEFLDDLRKF